MKKESRLGLSLTYNDAEFKRIAESISVELADVRTYADELNAAAGLYLADLRSPRRMPPTTEAKRLRLIASRAGRLLESLGVDNLEDAADGPEHRLLELLSWLDSDEDAVVAATERIARLNECTKGLAAAQDLARRARHSADEVVKLGEMTVPKGHQGNQALNIWVAGMIPIYEALTERAAGTSVGAYGTTNEGEAIGPFVRFLAAAYEPLLVLGLDEVSSDAWRSRFRIVNERRKEHSESI